MARLVTIAAIATLVLGCGGDTLPTRPESAPIMAGVIVARQSSMQIANHGPVMHVREVFGDECGIVFGLDEGTEIRRRTAEGALEAAGLAHLQAGRFVRVWIANRIVLSSCPGQAGADTVEIVADWRPSRRSAGRHVT